ncbi:MAG: sigma-70 family RNA polymerase sigma factor [Sarcina sp.]
MWINEKNFIEKLRKKDEKALNYVMDKYSSVVNGVVRKVLYVTKDEGVIEECIYDVFLSIWENIDKFKGRNIDFKNWVAGVSRYKAIDYYRKEKKKFRQIEIIDNFDNEESLDTPLDCILEEEVSKFIRETVDSCEEPDKSIIIMKVFLGYKTSYIANKLNLSNANVDTRFSRIRKKLRENYKKFSMEG